MVISGGSPETRGSQAPRPAPDQQIRPLRESRETHRLLEDVVRGQGRGVGWGRQVPQDGGGWDGRRVDHPATLVAHSRSVALPHAVHHLMVFG